MLIIQISEPTTHVPVYIHHGRYYKLKNRKSVKDLTLIQGFNSQLLEQLQGLVKQVTENINEKWWIKVKESLTDKLLSGEKEWLWWSYHLKEC